MAKTKISEFSSIPGNNTDIDSINLAEGCAPSGINDAIRELMAQLKDWQSGTSNDPYVVGSSGSLTLSYGTANGVAYLNGSKVLTTGSALTFDGTRLSSTVGKFGSGAAANSASLMVNNVTNTATGIQLFQDGIESWIMGMPANSAGLAWSASGSEQMRLTSTGLGIGTSSPTEKLHVAGALRVTGAQTTAGTGVYLDQTSGTGGVSVYGPDNSTQGTFRIYTATANGGTGSTKLTLDSSGNLGLGVTPSAWDTPYKAFDASCASVAGNSSGPTSWYANNVFVKAGTGSTYKASAPAAAYLQYQNQHQWFTAPSGTAGNAISFTQAMTLSAAGYLGIGTTNPPYGLTVSDAGGVGLEVGPGAQYSAGKLLLQAYNRSGGAYAQMDFAASLFTWLVSGTERARITNAGSLLVGTSSTYGRITSDGGGSSYAFAAAGGDSNLAFKTVNLSAGGIDQFFIRHNLGAVELGTASGRDQLALFANGFERARIDSSGNLLVGTTSTYGGPGRINVGFNQSTNFGLTFRNTSATATGVFVSFENSAGGGNGSISQTNSTTVAYNTSSDRRLKKDIAPAPQAGADIDAIQVVSHGWVSNDDTVKYGLIAQDLNTVAPQAVSAGDDSQEIERTWGVDYSKLVPMLIKEVQTLRARVAALEAA